jgi:hypothetical protein
MVLDVRIGCRAYDMCAYVADTERVAVRCGARSASCADGSTGAGDVLDDEGLTQRSLHPVAQHTRENIQ